MLFFSDTAGAPFRVFGPLHLFELFFVAAGIFLIWVLRRHLRRRMHETGLRWTFAAILFANMTVYYGSMMLMGTYDVRRHLPLEFCFITGYLFMYVLLTGNQKVWRVIWFFTVLGPLPAILWPNLNGSWDRFIFYQFFISHHVMLLMSVYALVVFRWRVSLRDALPAGLWALAMFGGIYLFNILFGTNYLMQQELPATVVRCLPFLKWIDLPVFWLLVSGALGLLLAGGLAMLLQDEPGKESSVKATVISPADDTLDHPDAAV